MSRDRLSRLVREAAMQRVAAAPDPTRLDFRWLQNFEFEGQRIPLVGQAGIIKPGQIDEALSIRTTYTRPGAEPPYADQEGADGLLRYKMRGDDPDHYQNRALRRAMADRLPLIWFVAIEKGTYQPIFPVYVVREEPEERQFVIALDPLQRRLAESLDLSEEDRRYAHTISKQRLHQPVFRSRVLSAYRNRCSICALQREELLDAAHIIADSQPHGRAIVPNGLALCKIHHVAYDKDIIGIRPDLTVHVRQDILEEVDGPMLKHGIQEMHGGRLRVVPSVRAARPREDFLEERYAAFLAR